MSVWKQFLGSLVRYFVIWLLGVLVSHTVIDQGLADKLTDSAVSYIVLGLMLGCPILWSLFKVWLNNLWVRVARDAAPGTSLPVIRREVWEQVKSALTLKSSTPANPYDFKG